MSRMNLTHNDRWTPFLYRRAEPRSVSKARKPLAGVLHTLFGVLLFFNLFFSTFAGSIQAASPSERPFIIVAFGDSLTAGYGLPAGRAFPSLLETLLKKDGFQVRVINAGVSGGTTAGGLSRLNWTLEGHPDLVIIELGANDGLRGLSPRRTEENLDAILTTLRRRKIATLLTGMLAPPNMGEAFSRAFNEIFPRLARKHQVPFYPFFLAGVAGNVELNQSDGIHPNEKGAEILTRNLYPHVKKLLQPVVDRSLE